MIMNIVLPVWIVLISGMFQSLDCLSVRTSTTTPVHVEEPLEPECQYHVPLDPLLLCRLLDSESQQEYSVGQKFCACPTYSECMRRSVPDPENLEKTKIIFICDRDTANDPAWEDMTDGLLRERYRKK